MAKTEESTAKPSTIINAGENVAHFVDGDILTIMVNIKHRGGKSASGKSITVGSTRGSVRINDEVTLGLNVYAKV